MNDEQLRDRLIKFIEEETQKATPTEELTDLQERRGQIKRRTEFIVASLDEETLADAQKELDRLKNERRSLDERIAAFEASARCGR